MAKLISGEASKTFQPCTLVIETAEELRCLYLKLLPEFSSMVEIAGSPDAETELQGWDMPSKDVDYRLWDLVACELTRQGERK